MGENCEICLSGYEGDATRGTPHDCRPVQEGQSHGCTCNPAGSISTLCTDGQCSCKVIKKDL